MPNETLLSICAQLAKQGKQPSIGLLKAKSKSKFHLADIIAAVQYWKSNPDWEATQKAEIDETQVADNLMSNELDSIEGLIHRVTYLESKVEKIESILAQLTNKSEKT